MTALVLRGMTQRRLRSALTAVAILLGVAMIAGTYVQTDQIKRAFTDIQSTAFGGTDVVITKRSAFDSAFNAVPAFDASVISRIEQVEGVRLVQGDLYQSGSLVRDGKRVGSQFAPGIVNSEGGPPFSPARYVRGHRPGAGEVAVNTKLARDEGLRIGEEVQVATRSGVQRARLAGVFDYGNVSSIGGATVIVAPLADVQRWYRLKDRVTAIDIAADPGVSADDLAARLQAVVPDDLRVRTGQAEAASQAERINDAIGGFLTPLLLALSGAAVLVGGFIIFNTFSITVAQRVREFALLRSLGATRRQLVAAVIGEALLIGVIATALGIAAGFGFAAGLGALFDAAGFGIPRGGMELATRTIVVCALVGIGVSLLAVLGPALRATRIPPVLALAGNAAPTPHNRRVAPVVAGVVLVLGLALLAVGLFGGGPATSRIGALGGGAVLLFVGLALSARWFVRPIASLVGWPIQRLSGMPGRLARENAMRNPGRTATTSAALMVGLGLVVFVAVFAAGLKQSVEGNIDELIRAEFIVGAGNVEPLPAGATAAIESAPGVDELVPVNFDQVQVNGAQVKTNTDTIEGIDPTKLSAVYDVDWVEGSDATLRAMRDGQALVDRAFAEAHGVSVGETFSVQLPAGARREVTAVGIYDDPQILQGMLVTQTDFQRLSENLDPYLFLIRREPGVTDAALQATLEDRLEQFPAAKVYTKAAYHDYIVGNVDQIVSLLYALLAMSVLISLFGLANSLILSIHERTREFGLLRAVGATDRQVRRVVRYESVITSVIGGVLGIAVGLLFGWLVTVALADLGLGFTVPGGQLVVFLALAVLVGVIGAVWPARRGARIDVLAALRTE